MNVNCFAHLRIKILKNALKALIFTLFEIKHSITNATINKGRYSLAVAILARWARLDVMTRGTGGDLASFQFQFVLKFCSIRLANITGILYSPLYFSLKKTSIYIYKN